MSKNIPSYRAFTCQCNGVANRLVAKATAIYNNNENDVLTLWDTGATGTCISNELAKKLSMVPTGRKDIKTPSGTKEVNTYLLDIMLPNHVGIKDVLVCDSDIGNQGIDMLIGMDIILLGDFATSNFNNETTFTFRVPSKQRTDYVRQIAAENKIGKKHGSGKKKRK